MPTSLNPKPAPRKPRKPSNASGKKSKEPQEFPISHTTLRHMYDAMIESRMWAQSNGATPALSEATAVAAALAVKANDIFAAPADGRTLYPITHEDTAVVAYDAALVRQALGKVRRQHRHAILLAIITEGDLDSTDTGSLLSDARQNLWPIVFLALTDRAFRPSAPVIEIDVDGHDAVAVYRVVSESIRRARNGGGPAVIHAHGATTPLSASSQDNPLERFQAYLNAKGLSTKGIHVLHKLTSM